MEGCSEEALDLLSRGASLVTAPASQRSRLGLFGSELTNMPATGVRVCQKTFQGSLSGLPLARDEKLGNDR